MSKFHFLDGRVEHISTLYPPRPWVINAWSKAQTGLNVTAEDRLAKNLTFDPQDYIFQSVVEAIGLPWEVSEDWVACMLWDAWHQGVPQEAQWRTNESNFKVRRPDLIFTARWVEYFEVRSQQPNRVEDLRSRKKQMVINHQLNQERIREIKTLSKDTGLPYRSARLLLESIKQQQEWGADLNADTAHEQARTLLRQADAEKPGWWR